MVVYKNQTREDELIKALETIASMTTSDVVNVVFKLMNENKHLKEEINKLKEDKAENEATYKEMMNTQYGLDAEALDRLSEAFKKEILRNEQTEQN